MEVLLTICNNLHNPVSQTRWDPLPLEKSGENRPRWKKYPEISYPLEKYIELPSPLGRTLEFWEFPPEFETPTH